MKKLRDVVPHEFFAEFMFTTSEWTQKPSPAAKLLDVEVTAEHSTVGAKADNMRWPGPQKNVCCWWELANGKAVAWNENVARGWSFPVITIPAKGKP